MERRVLGECGGGEGGFEKAGIGMVRRLALVLGGAKPGWTPARVRVITCRSTR